MFFDVSALFCFFYGSHGCGFLNRLVPLWFISNLYPFASSSLHSCSVVASAYSSKFSCCFVVVACFGYILTWLYALMYESVSSSSVGKLYASRLLISWCPNIWSIQFVGIPPFSKQVWSFFLMLCALRCCSPVLMKADATKVLRLVLDSFVGLLLSAFTNSGESGVIVSGFILLVPFLRWLR